ncbi:hypothetical protein GCM10022235_16220 [Kribbella ginsengisoli]|uniref:Uncharacterized protein n=1 Tax=Kribbella ginsengisoli TaxID=363865 RepID=A0ABP6WC92_9ACTN
MLRPGGCDIDRIRPVDNDIRSAIGQRDVLEPDVEVGIGLPPRTRGEIKSVRDEASQSVVPDGGAGVTMTIPSTTSMPEDCSADQESYCPAVTCVCIHLVWSHGLQRAR